MGIGVDGRQIHVQLVRAQAGSPETFEVPLTLEAGKHRLSVAYLNNFNADGDRNVYLVSSKSLGHWVGNRRSIRRPIGDG